MLTLRLLGVVAIVFVLSVLIFGMMHLIPGDPAELLLSQGSIAPDPQAVAALRERIDAFQRARETRHEARPADEETDAAAPTLPFSDASTAQEELTGFGFSTDTSGVIDWADSFAASRVLYLSLQTILPDEYSEAIEWTTGSSCP